MVFSMCFPKSSGGGNALQRVTEEEKKKNMEIDRLLRKDKKMQARQVKILLLGRQKSHFRPHTVAHRSQVLVSRVNQPY